MCFSWSDWGYRFLWAKPQRWSAHAHHIILLYPINRTSLLILTYLFFTATLSSRIQITHWVGCLCFSNSFFTLFWSFNLGNFCWPIFRFTGFFFLICIRSTDKPMEAVLVSATVILFLTSPFDFFLYFSSLCWNCPFIHPYWLTFPLEPLVY